MDTTSRIYELIKQDNSINTFNNNQELFMDFFYHNIDLIYGNKNTFDVFEYILSLNLNDEDETYPFINSKIFDAFNRYEQRITQKYFSQGSYNDEDVESIYDLIDKYYRINKYKENSMLNKLYDEDSFIRDCTNAMMILLNSSFFDLSNDNIKKMMESIKNNKYLRRIIESGSMGNTLLDQEYIHDYASRFLFNSFFYNKEDALNDELLIAIKSKKITDINTFEKLIKKIDISLFLHTFEDNYSSFIDVIENTYNDQMKMIDISNYVVNKLYNEGELSALMNFLMDDERANIYLDDRIKDSILTLYPYSSSKPLTDKEVNYLLDNCKDNEILLNNLKEDLRHNNWSNETIARVEDETKDIQYYDLDTKTAIKVFDVLFSKGSGVNYPIVVAAIKRLIKDYTKDENIKVYVTYLSPGLYGFEDSINNMISLSAQEIAKMIKETNLDMHPEKIHILNTIYHEGRHINQAKEGINSSLDDKLFTQYKEDVLRMLCLDYYTNNYKGISFESDARICGAKELLNLLNTYYPYMKNSIDYYNKELQNELNNQEEIEKSIFELSGKKTITEILDKIISINPKIVEDNVQLQKEYNSEGERIK